MTSPRIAVLPPALADQIAAGEVVERAASVVKELCENAIDAGARRIEIEIDGGGRRFVRVVDDGGGMTPEEARLALRRHATSKIRSADDLWGLSTFGFRGEALPSIAAVSRLTLATKPSEAAAGFRMTVEGGTETEAREVGIPTGTQIEVRDLFFNTPARLKFQKAEATEAANVTEAVLRLALGHPQVHFRLRAGGRTILDLPAHQRLAERVRAALARRGAGALHEAAGEEGGHSVQAFLAAPEEASSTARSTFLFVGRRFIRDRPLLQALSLGYGELLEKGRYPLAALFIDVPGSDVDINVHPQKMEVRFARPAEVYAAVRHVIAGGVARAPWLPAARGTMRMHTLPPLAPEAAAGPDGNRPGMGGAAGGVSSQVDRAGASVRQATIPAGAPVTSRRGATWHDATRHASEPGPRSPGQYQGASAFFQSLSYIGQLGATYLVCEGNQELVLIDQHAAHECVAFERLRAAHLRGEVRQQRLLFPVPVQIGPDVAPLSARAISRLLRLGFEVEPSDQGNGEQVVLRSVPEPTKDADPKPLLREVLRKLGELPTDPSDEISSEISTEILTKILSTMACHSVVRAGDIVERPWALALLAQLDGLDLETHGHPGRAVVLRMPVAEIDRRFGHD